MDGSSTARCVKCSFNRYTKLYAIAALALAGILIVAGSLVYILNSNSNPTGESGFQAAAGKIESVEHRPPPPPAQGCAQANDPKISIADLNLIQQAARKSATGDRWEAALAKFRELLSKSPGYPGVNLDISDSLMRLKDFDGARKAVNAQLTVSECLSKLPGDEVAGYCKSMDFQLPEACKNRLQSIWQQAYFQSALISTAQGNNDEARGKLELALKQFPGARGTRIEREARNAIMGVKPAVMGVKPAIMGAKPAAPVLNQPTNNDNKFKSGEGTETELGRFPRK